MGEFEAVLKLDPANLEAARFLGQISANQNVLGLANDLDVTPDFNTYRDAFRDWYPVFDSLYRSAISSLLANVQLEGEAANLTARISSIQNGERALQLDVDAATLGQVAGKELDHAKIQLAELQRQIQEAHDEMQHHDVLTLGNWRRWEWLWWL